VRTTLHALAGGDMPAMKGAPHMNATVTTNAPSAQQLARATSDYLAISRGRAKFASDASWDQAEQVAWDNLMVLTQLISDGDATLAARA
jgi:hypothetical protein